MKLRFTSKPFLFSTETLAVDLRPVSLEYVATCMAIAAAALGAFLLWVKLTNTSLGFELFNVAVLLTLAWYAFSFMFR